MSGFNKYPNLPGMLSEFKDGGLQLKQEADPPVTDSMLILGTAVDGPVMEPVAVDPSTVSALLGPAVSGNGVPNGATLLPAFEKAWMSGCRDIRVMRISGKESVAVIKSGEVSINEHVVKEQQLGVVQGNDETTLTLGNTPIVPGSVLAKANGSIISNGVIVDEATGDIIVEAGKCNAGASLAFDYEYFELTPQSTATLTVADNAGELSVEAEYNIEELVELKQGEYGIASGQYTVAGKLITFIPGAVDANGTAIAGSAELMLTYKGRTGHLLQASENGNVEGPFIAATSEQEFPLAEQPVPGSTHVYANGSEVLDAIAFRVDGTEKKLFIKKEYFGKGELITTSYLHNVSAVYTPEITMTSIFGGSVYNANTVKVESILDATDNVIGKVIIITKPESKKSQIAEEALRFSSLNYPNFRLMVNAINSHPLNNIVKASTAHEATATAELLDTGVVYFGGGEDGLNLSSDQVFKALSGERNVEGAIVKQGAYQLLEDYNVDSIIVEGIYANTPMPGKFQNFAYELAMFCAYSSYRNKTIHGFINMMPPVDTKLADIQKFVKEAASYDNNWFMRDQRGNLIKDAEGNQIDLGSYLSVVVGPQHIVATPSLGRHFADPAILYCAMNTVLEPQSAPTNKAVTGSMGLRYRLSNAQLEALTVNRMVTFKLKDDGRVYVVDGMTSAQPGSDYVRLTTVQVVKATIDEVREVCDPFIGEPNTIEQRNAMSSLIEKRLSRLKEAGVIQNYDFQVIASIQDQLLGNAKIELTIVPPQELRKITTVVSVKPTL